MILDLSDNLTEMPIITKVDRLCICLALLQILIRFSASGLLARLPQTTKS